MSIAAFTLGSSAMRRSPPSCRVGAVERRRDAPTDPKANAHEAWLRPPFLPVGRGGPDTSWGPTAVSTALRSRWTLSRGRRPLTTSTHCAATVPPRRPRIYADALPTYLTRFVGRQQDWRSVRLEELPVGTICGMGGLGKTRLAIEPAKQIRATGRPRRPPGFLGTAGRSRRPGTWPRRWPERSADRTVRTAGRAGRGERPTRPGRAAVADTASTWPPLAPELMANLLED